ncbi:Purine nucleoside phosphorylase [Bacillus safensis]|nr:Purine nucleoside phosphorylase [Bacillus safensis]
MIVVSACLAGLKVRYNGSHRLDQRIEELVEEGKAVTVCPELLGGLSTPRPPAEIIGGDGHDVLQGLASVIDVHGNDVTEMYVKGAKAALEQVLCVKRVQPLLRQPDDLSRRF